MKGKIFKLTLLVCLLACALAAVSACSLFGGGDSGNGVVNLEKCHLALHNMSADSHYAYNACAVEPEVDVLDAQGMRQATVSRDGTADLDISYSNNVNAGMATVTVTAKSTSKAFKGSVSLQFEILRTSAYVLSMSELKAAANDPNYDQIVVNYKMTVAEGDTLTVADFAKVTFNEKLCVFGTLQNDGELILKNELQNEGTFVNNGTLELSEAQVWDFGTADFGQNVLGSGAIYTVNGQLALSVPNVEVVHRANLSSVGITLKETQMDYTGAALEPELLLPEGVSLHDLEVSYQNNRDAGTAEVSIVAPKFHTQFFGEVHLPFTVLPIVAQVDLGQYGTLADLARYLDSDNYTGVELSVPSMQLCSTVSVPQGKTLRVLTDCAILPDRDQQNYWVNNGTVTFWGNLSIEIPFTNNGEVSVSGNVTLRTAASFVNSGTITVTGGGTFADGFTNAGSLAFGSDALYFNGSVTNNGNITVGEQCAAFFAENPQGNAVKIGGTAYVNGANWAVEGGNVVIRKQLQTQNVTLQYQTVPYDTQSHLPTLSVCDDDVLIPQNNNEYSYGIHPEGETTYISPVSVGTYDVVVTFNNKSQTFFGSAIAQYQIVPSVAEVSTPKAFQTALDDRNYSKVVVVATFDLPFTIISKPVNLEIAFGACLYLTSRMSVFGSVINNGTVHCKDDHTSQAHGILEVEESGTFVNNGKVILFDVDSDNGIQNGESGTIHRKISMEDARITVAQIGRWQYKQYDSWSRHIQDFEIKLDGDPLPIGEYDIFAQPGTTIGAGDNPVIFRAYDNAADVYGEVCFSANVQPGVVEVATFAALHSAVNSKNSYGEPNYCLVTVTEDLVAKLPGDYAGYGTGTVSLDIPTGLTLDLRGHTLVVEKSPSYAVTCSLEINIYGKVLIDRTSAVQVWYIMLRDGVPLGGELVFYMNKQNAASYWKRAMESNYSANVVVLTEDISASDLGGNPTAYPDLYARTLDLNGHTLDATLTVTTANVPFAIVSSGEKGRLTGLVLKNVYGSVVLSNLYLPVDPDSLTDTHLTVQDCELYVEE